LSLRYTTPITTVTTSASRVSLGGYISEGTSDISDTNIAVGQHNTDGDIRRGLIKFDLSSIPSSATIQSAVLHLCLKDDTYANWYTNIFLNRLLVSWDANATWIKRTNSYNWTTAGGWDANDVEVNTSIAVFMRNYEVYGYNEIYLRPDLFQEWIDGTLENNGMLISTQYEDNDMVNFYNTYSEMDFNSPYLVVDYIGQGGKQFQVIIMG
jgi:hypothetical protein